ncbi:hypothetical protein VTP01DRAFT_3991 [Rhizomucor pusillus]|uniref:uncharacterized protein n=1 Tax=Rhizomucor pusillus TaxID=4840 RepID=UPI003743FB8D
MSSGNISQEANVLFQDNLNITDIDPEGKRFDRVSRLVARSTNYDLDIILDFNSEIYPLQAGEKIFFVLASSLSLEPEKKKEKNPNDKKERVSWRERAPGERDISDEFEYVMYGKVYRYDDSTTGAGTAAVASGQKVSVNISFGGMLCSMEGDYRPLQNLVVGDNVYLLIRK